MLIDFQKQLVDIHDNPMTEIAEKAKVVNGEITKTYTETKVTLGQVCANALLAPFQDEPNLDAAEKVKRFRLAEQASKYLPSEVSVDDVALIKKLLAKAFSPLIVGRAFDLIEPPKVGVLAPVAAAENQAG